MIAAFLFFLVLFDQFELRHFQRTKGEGDGDGPIVFMHGVEHIVDHAGCELDLGFVDGVHGLLQSNGVHWLGDLLHERCLVAEIDIDKSLGLCG